MSMVAAPKTAAPTTGKPGAARGLQRKCGCGSHTSSSTGECPECLRRKRLQPKLTIGGSNDPLEREADRIADRVVAGTADQPGSAAPLRIQRFTGQALGDLPMAPDSVDRALASPGLPLDPSLRQGMEQRFGHDFSRVRVHSDAAAATSARHISAHAYTSGYDIVFGAGRFAPATAEGRRLLAHELTHVVQQNGVGAPVRRDESAFNPIPKPQDLLDMYEREMIWAKRFDRIAAHLATAVSFQPSPYAYVIEVFEKIDSDYEDNVGAEFVNRLSTTKLNQFAADREGRLALTMLYRAIITGEVTEFEREQANRVLLAKTKQIKPEHFVRMATRRGGREPKEGERYRTPIFPIRFMRVTPGQDYAPPELTWLSNGNLLVRYHVGMKSMSTFREEIPTLGDVFGRGMELNPNEIVGVRDYERGGDVIYLPALALVDYANQAAHSTAGKIVEVVLFTATLPLGGAGAAGGRAAVAAEASAAAKWGSRLAKTAGALDRVANFIGIASFFINENRDWIIGKFGNVGRRLVQVAEVANSAAAIYGLARLGQGGYQIVKEMRTASRQARAMGKDLTPDQANALSRIDDETNLMLRELDDEAAKRAAPAAAGGKPGAPPRVDDPAAVKPPAKAAPKPGAAVDDLDAAAGKIGISKTQLHHEVEDLRGQTVDPDLVHQPRNPKFDAEMDAQGHNFTRNKTERTWCRESKKTCRLNLGEKLNTETDAALAKKQAKFEELERQRKAREAAPPRQPVQKREPTAATDPKKAKAEARARQKAARASTKKVLETRIDDAKSLELQLRIEIARTEQRAKRPLDAAKRAAEDAKKRELARQLNNQIDARQALQKQLDDLAITPYDRARAFSYSDAAANEVIGRARKAVDAPGGQKKLAVVDEMSGKPVKEPSIDHVVPIDEMVHMDGWNDLRPHQQRELLSRTDNLRMMEKSANSSKGSRPWAKWPEGKKHYGETVWLEMVEAEKKLRTAIQTRIKEMLAGKAA